MKCSTVNAIDENAAVPGLLRLFLVMVLLSLPGPGPAATGDGESAALTPADAAEGGLECRIYEFDDAVLKAERAKKIKEQITRAQNFELGERKRLASCNLTVDSLVSAQKASESLLIDIRRPSEFRNFHIPGSLNIPGKKILTQGQWRRKGIVLISEGHSYVLQDQLCRELRGKGFEQVFVLEGGIRSWQAQGNSLTGLRPADSKIGEMRAHQFFSESAYAHWLLLLADGITPPGLDSAQDHIVTVRADDKNALEQIKQGYDRYRQTIGENPLILVVADDLRVRRELQSKALQVSSLSFSLEGGIEQYRSYLHRQQVVWNHRPGVRRNRQCGR